MAVAPPCWPAPAPRVRPPRPRRPRSSCADTATAVELADDLLVGGPEQVDRLHAFATLSARRAAAAANDVAEPEPARLARTAAAVRQVWTGPRYTALAEAVVASPAFPALAWRLHELAERGYAFTDVLGRIDPDRLIGGTVRDPAALAEWFVEQMAPDLRVINLDPDDPATVDPAAGAARTAGGTPTAGPAPTPHPTTTPAGTSAGSTAATRPTRPTAARGATRTGRPSAPRVDAAAAAAAGGRGGAAARRGLPTGAGAAAAAQPRLSPVAGVSASAAPAGPAGREDARRPYRPRGWRPPGIRRATCPPRCTAIP